MNAMSHRILPGRCPQCSGVASHLASCPARGFSEVVDAPDLDNPNRTILRARRVDPLRALNLADREWAAALRFRDEADMARGARQDAVGAALAHWQRTHYPDAQLNAVTSLTGAIQAIGITASPVAVAVIVEWRSLRDTAEELGIGRPRATERLQIALEALVDYYG